MDIHQFDAIRPFEPEELPEVFDRLLQNEQFKQVLAYLYPGVPVEMIGQKMHQCRTNLEFQKAFCYDFLHNLLAKASLGIDSDFQNIDLKRRYTFVSNHRDIVLDSALLHKLLFDAGCDTTTEIAIGDNLLKLPWVKDIVRINKSFIVERSLSMRQMLVSSKRMADYMHFVISEKNDNIWIAQREGRAKNSDDRTQEAILKMMAMGGEGSVKQRLLSLHIVPLAISYEYDPCDFLKAQEDYDLSRQNLDLTLKSMEQDSLYRSTQLQSLRESLDNMRLNMQLIRRRKESLTIKAPIDGVLGLLDANLGQYIGAGTKIGQINSEGSYKIEAKIDEHYIDRVVPGLDATFERQSEKYDAQVRKVYPEVRDGKFQADFKFEGQQPDNIRTGQTYYLNLQLGQPEQAVLIPRGTFYQKTGGKWIYVVTKDGGKAVKREIRIGRQNPQFYEVLEGLEPGEKVITSSYDNYGDSDVLVF